MKKILDKIKRKIKVDKNLIIFLIILMLIGITSGSIFVTIINENDKLLVSEHINEYLNSIDTGQVNNLLSFKNNIITNLIFIMVVWLLGISVVGSIIIIILFFAKSFILGFTLGSIIYTFKTKGILLALTYIFPSNILNLLFMLLLTMYALSFSIYLVYAIFKKKTIDFKTMINKYLIVLGMVLIATVLFSLYDSFLTPNIIKSILKFIF